MSKSHDNKQQVAQSDENVSKVSQEALNEVFNTATITTIVAAD